MEELKKVWFQLVSTREGAGLLIGLLTLVAIFLPSPIFGLLLLVLSYLFGLELENILGRRFLRFILPLTVFFSLFNPFLGLLILLITALGWGYFQVKLRGYYSHETFKGFLEVIFVGLYGGLLTALLFHIKEVSTYLLLAMVLTVWASDTVAYYVGKNFGRQPFMALISPSKTFEGFLGGTIAGTLVGVFISSLLGLEVKNPLLWFFVVLSSVAGDLFESFIKRSFGVKDSSNLLGSHGGFLDRFDALLFASLTLYALL